MINLETILFAVAISVSAVSLVATVICYKRQRTQRGLLEFAENQIVELQDTVAKTRESLEISTQRTSEHSRRVAWLETRLRQPKLLSDEVIDDSAQIETPKLNMTERRHRVIALASRGQHTDAIATTLGMLPGEVELILSLNKAMAATR
jgi:hypothetical protein